VGYKASKLYLNYPYVNNLLCSAIELKVSNQGIFWPGYIKNIVYWLGNSKFDTEMSKPIRILKYTFVLILFAFFTGNGCVSVSKTKFNHKKKGSSCSLADLVGPDTYYYSDHYQKKLKKSIKKISRK
jgi:hypothetical protein